MPGVTPRGERAYETSRAASTGRGSIDGSPLRPMVRTGMYSTTVPVSTFPAAASLCMARR